MTDTLTAPNPSTIPDDGLPSGEPCPPAVHPASGGITLAEVGGLVNGNALGGGDQHAGEQELLRVVGDLQREGAPIPADVDLALTRLGEFDQLCRPESLGDPAAVLGRIDLQLCSAQKLDALVDIGTMARIRRDYGVDQISMVRTALLARAVAGLADAVPVLLYPAVDSFRDALVDVERAVAAGIGPDTTAADVIDSDDGVAAWRRLVAADSGVGRLTKLWRLRCRLVRVVGCHVPSAPAVMPEPDPFAARLAAMAGNSYSDSPATAAPGVPDGWGRAGRSAWLVAVASGSNLVAEFAAPVLIPARINENTGRDTVALDAPTKWDLERSTTPAPEPTPVYPDGAYLGSELFPTV